MKSSSIHILNRMNDVTFWDECIEYLEGMLAIEKVSDFPNLARRVAKLNFSVDSISAIKDSIKMRKIEHVEALIGNSSNKLSS